MSLSPEQVNAFIAEVYPLASSALRCEELASDWVRARWMYDASTLRPGGFISGPTIFTLADVALWFLSFTQLGLQAMAVTSDLHIDFLRPAAGGDLIARADLLRAGATRITGRVSLWIEGKPDRPVAHATGSYSLLRSKP